MREDLWRRGCRRFQITPLVPRLGFSPLPHPSARQDWRRRREGLRQFQFAIAKGCVCVCGKRHREGEGRGGVVQGKENFLPYRFCCLWSRHLFLPVVSERNLLRLRSLGAMSVINVSSPAPLTTPGPDCSVPRQRINTVACFLPLFPC